MANQYIYKPRGVYDPAATYSKYDVVKNPDTGNFHCAMKDLAAGVTPNDDGVNWVLFQDAAARMSGDLAVALSAGEGEEGGPRPAPNYTLGANLKERFGTAEAFAQALRNEDYDRFFVGDYWPVTLNGTFRDYGSYTVPSGVTYYSDAALTTEAGTTSAKMEGQYESATAVKFNAGGANVFCATGDCLDYFERTLTNAIVNLEIAGIDNYWRYGDSGDLTGNKPHITFASRDCLPVSMRMRKSNAVWETPGETNPWRGSALFKTLNDPDYGVVKLIADTDIGAYMYAGPNGGGMRALMEVKAPGAATATASAWADRGKLFLPFEPEIWGHSVFGGNSAHVLGANLQLPIFAGTRRHISKGIGNGGYRSNWWTASSTNGDTITFSIVYNDGSPNKYGAYNRMGVPVCFVMA